MAATGENSGAHVLHVEKVVGIDGGYFCAGIVARDGRVIEVAPILRRHIKRGMDGKQVAAIVKRKGWKWHT